VTVQLALNANFIILGSCYRRTINLPAIIRIVSVQTEYLDEYSIYRMPTSWPPSIAIVAPVMKVASSEHNQVTVAATSSG
jgi:hypothetical protein